MLVCMCVLVCVAVCVRAAWVWVLSVCSTRETPANSASPRPFTTYDNGIPVLPPPPDHRARDGVLHTDEMCVCKTEVSAVRISPNSLCSDPLSATIRSPVTARPLHYRRRLYIPPLQAKKRWEAEMKERGLSKDEAFMVETAQSAELVSQHKNKKEKHKAAFGEFSNFVVWACVKSSAGLIVFFLSRWFS